MRRKPTSIEARPAQPTPEDLRDILLNFIRTHWYGGQSGPDRVQFYKDRRLLLKWVVLKFAAWLDQRGVTLPPERYREIMLKNILQPALAHGQVIRIAFVPAYLGKTVETHLAMHGDEYYDEAKSLRHRLQSVLAGASRSIVATPVDPVRELAAAARLLQPKKPTRKTRVNPQLRQGELL